MTPISADDLMFDEDGPGGAVSADDLQFDTPAPKAGKKKPAQPKLKPLGELRKQAKEFTTEPSKGIPIITPRKPALDLVKARKQAKGFTATPEQEGVVVGQDNSAPTGLRVAGIKRRDGESLDSFLAREKVWREQEYQRESGERAQRAAMRAELTPKGGAVRNWIEQEVPLGAAVMGLGEGLDLGSLGQGVTAIENAVSGFGQGVGESIRTMGIGASLVTGTEPDSLALQPRMPTMNPADSASWAGKLGQGGGSMAMFMLASPLLGPTGATLLGAAQNAGQTYEEARARGVSHDEALAAAVPGALIGALEGIGGGGGAATGFIKGTLGEAGQEGLSQVLNNINAKFISGYDPQRAITEGVMESAVLGGLLGAGVHGVTNIGELTQLPQQIDKKLRELGIEQSFGSLPDEGKQAGVELYAGLDPKLIRDFLPRPETIRSLFNSLFKGVKSTDQDIDAQLESSKTRLFAQIESRKQALMQKAPSYPDIYEATPEQLDEVLDVPELKWVWSDVIPIAPLSDPKIQKLYKQSYNFNSNGSYSIDITYVPTGEIINTVPFGPGMSDANKQAALVAARDSWQRQMRGDSDYSPELVEMLDETYEELKQSKKLRYQKEVEKDLRSIEKHVRRWLDKQKWGLQRNKQKEVGPGIESRTGAEPQGIVVHKISAQNLNRLLQEAENDITKAQQPMPSIGVIHPETDFDSFGGIQLIATPSLVEDAVKAGLAYPTDFYTPTAADAMYKMGEYSITPSNVQKIVDQMIRETKDYGDRRLSEAQAVFENAAIFNSYAKAGGAFESMDAVKEGLGALKPGAKTESMTPEFSETREVQREFNNTRNELFSKLAELEGAMDWEAVKDFSGWPIDPEDPTEGFHPKIENQKNYLLTREIDQYLLTQLSKPSLPSSDQLAIGIKKILSQTGIDESVFNSEGEIIEYALRDKWSVEPFGKGKTIDEAKKAALKKLTSPSWGWTEDEVKNRFNAGQIFIDDVKTPGLGTQIKNLADKAATAFYTFRQAPTIYMEAQPPRGVRLDEYVAALVPHTKDNAGANIAEYGVGRNTLNRVADTLAAQGIKVYRYGSPEEKVAIQKALAQFKDVVVNPASSYGALYSNPVFDPEAWKRAKEAWVPGQPDPEQELLARAEHVPRSEKTSEVIEGGAEVPGAEGKADGVSGKETTVKLRPDDVGVESYNSRKQSGNVSEQMDRYEQEFWKRGYGSEENVSTPGLEIKKITVRAGDVIPTGRPLTGERLQRAGDFLREGGWQYDSESEPSAREADNTNAIVIRDLDHPGKWIAMEGNHRITAMNKLDPDALIEVDQMELVGGILEEQARDYSELDADDLEWDDDDVMDPVETQLREVYEAATKIGESTLTNPLKSLQLSDLQDLQSHDLTTLPQAPNVDEADLDRDNPTVNSSTPSIGSWRINNNYTGRVRNVLERLVLVDPTKIKLSETPREDRVTKYVTWLKSGHEAPPISVEEDQDGSFIVSLSSLGSGNHRLAAARSANKPIKAWVSYRNPFDKSIFREPLGLETVKSWGNNPPPLPPNNSSSSSQQPNIPLTETVVAKDRYAQLREKLMQAAVAKGYKWDLSIPPGLQLARAIKAGYLEMDNMTEVLAQAGMTVNDLADLAEFTQHRAGQILNELSKITKELDDLISTNPQLASLIIGPNKVMQRGLKKLEASELGHSIWERSGSIMRKNFLSRLSTAFVQVWSTTAQIPLDIASGAIAGLGMRFLNPAKWQHNTTGMLATAKEDIVRGIEPVLALARGMNPAQITDLLRWQKPSKQMEYKKIVDDLSLIYPEIYGKLHGREDIVPGQTGYTSPAALRQVLSQVKDPALRREYEVKLRTLEGREKFNKSLRGKVLKGYENALDVILMPLSIQEYAFRRPMFVGALQRELEARGLDLNDFIANPKKVAGARDMLQSAVDEALRFTWAYEPKAGNKALGQTEQAMEGAANYFIKFWNKLGPIGATLEAFPRALTNGLKFAYEWSPLGILSPAWQAQDKMRHGARDQVTFQEAQRMAQGVVGTMMYGIALGLREWAGGEEWWQLKTGKKNKDGKPVYYDARRIPQLAFFLNAADLAKRAMEDTLGDIKAQQRLTDTYLGARRNSQPGDLGAIDQFMLMWTGDTVPTNAKQKSKLAAGQWASTFVIPLSNIRDAWAQFSVQEGAKRDLRESPWLGPSLDKLPWLRRDLPLAEGPFEQSPQLGAYAPLAEGEGLGPVTGAFALGGAIGATRMTPGQSFAAREFARLGLSPFTWLKRDPNPAIDRAQWKRMTTILQAVGNSLANNPGYAAKSPDQQRALWEEIIGGPEGAAAEAKAAGLESNQKEADRRKELQSVPPYRRKAIGLDKLIPPVGQP